MTWELVYVISGLAILPVLIIAILISLRVTLVIARYHQVQGGDGGTTGKDLVRRIAAANNLDVQVEATTQGDHYDPRGKVIRLSEKVYHGTSLSALAIAAHECGHALQDATNYAPLKMRQMVIKVNNFSSRLLTPLIIISLLASVFLTGYGYDNLMQYLLIGFCVVYGLSALVGLITLPTEFNASRRGKAMLRELGLVEDAKTQRAVDKVLDAAANTYVVSFAMSLLYFLRYLSILAMRRRD